MKSNSEEFTIVELNQEDLSSIVGGGLGVKIGYLIGYVIAGVQAYTDAVRESNSQIAWYDKK